jgi:hypothetical protein
MNDVIIIIVDVYFLGGGSNFAAKNKLTKIARVRVLPRGPFRLPDKLSQSFPVAKWA